MIIFVFSDPGGAKAILASAVNEGGPYRIYTDKKYAFFDEFNLPVHHISDVDEHGITEILSHKDVTTLKTATSYPGQLELKFIECAGKLGIESSTYIDAWVNMQTRFHLTEDHLCLPDHILLIDEEAKAIAIREGLPEERIQIVGQPYHEYLRSWTPAQNRREFIEKYHLDHAKKILVLAPDPLTEIGGKEVYGTDETETIAALMEGIENNHLTDKFQVIIQLHPKQNISLIRDALDKHSENWIPWSGLELTSLLYFCDAIIGMSSNFLIEAQILDSKIIRYFKDCTLSNDYLKPRGFKSPYDDISDVIRELQEL